jgi:hypothetical protein
MLPPEGTRHVLRGPQMLGFIASSIQYNDHNDHIDDDTGPIHFCLPLQSAQNEQQLFQW